MSSLSKINLVGIGGSEAPPNPRLPAYIFPALPENGHPTNLVLTSSINGAMEYNAQTEEQRHKIEFNTRQKIEFVQRFVREFLDGVFAEVGPYYAEASDQIDRRVWLEIWELVESLLDDQEKHDVYQILNRFNKSVTLDGAKSYVIRHAFWFKDLSLPQDDDLNGHTDLRSIGGPQERFFNFFRSKIEEIPLEKLENIMGTPLIRRKVQQVIYPFKSAVVPYGEATRKSGKKRLSIEVEPGENADICSHYQGRHQKKARLNRDIEDIGRRISLSEYQDFWDAFQDDYIEERNNF